MSCMQTDGRTDEKTDRHAPSEIRTRNLSMRWAAEPRFRPLGHWDRPDLVVFTQSLLIFVTKT